MRYDAIVLGAGLYGTKVVLTLKRLGLNVVIFDQNERLFQGATLVNQQRIHQGFHYPRSLTTAMTARKYYDRFLIDYAPAVGGNKRHLYLIAEGSKVNATDYEKVMSQIGAHFVPTETPSYFAPGMIEQAFETHEKSFNIDTMRGLIWQQLNVAGIEVIHSEAHILGWDDSVRVQDQTGQVYEASYVFNCTYANIDKIAPLRTKLKKEHVEVAIFNGVYDEDITIMDGEYFSLMKYLPREGMSALTHVKYGRHQIWFPPDELEPKWGRQSRVKEMIADIKRFIPDANVKNYVMSMYTTRVLLVNNKDDDGRPVLWEYHPSTPRIISILGSKFNSIYDVEDELVKGEWMTQPLTSVKKVGRRALIGRGFIGSNLDRPGRFTDRYNSKNVHEMSGHYDLIVVAAPSAEKWIANRRPDVDEKSVNDLILALCNTTADRLVLISTIDVTKEHPYGEHRRELERFVVTKFPKKAVILRLPALFGPGLKKNVLYDLLTTFHDGFEDRKYQWYNIKHLWNDILLITKTGIWRLYSEPIDLSEITSRFFPNAIVSRSKYCEDYNEESDQTRTKEMIFIEMEKFIIQWRIDHASE